MKAKMVRQRRVQIESKADKSRNSSSSNGSNSTKYVQSTKWWIPYWKHIIGFTCLCIAIVIGYIGYLETRVNTPYDDKKVSILTFFPCLKGERYYSIVMCEMLLKLVSCCLF